MNIKNISDWVQIFTGIAVIVGLGIVVYELRQNREIAEVNVAQVILGRSDSLRVAMIGESTADAFGKACQSPAELTQGEMVALIFYFQKELSGPTEVLLLELASTFKYGNLWQNTARSAFKRILRNPFGRYWCCLLYTSDAADE